MDDVKKTGMNWRLLAIGVGFASVTIVLLSALSDVSGRAIGIALAVTLIVVMGIILLLDRPRK